MVKMGVGDSCGEGGRAIAEVGLSTDSGADCGPVLCWEHQVVMVSCRIG